jgi:hypothetical protein
MMCTAARLNQAVISVPTPWEIRVSPRHPEVERIVQEKVGKNQDTRLAYPGAAAVD